MLINLPPVVPALTTAAFQANVVSRAVDEVVAADVAADVAGDVWVATVEVNRAEEVATGVAVVLELLDVVSADAARKNPGLEICSEVLK